MKNECLLCGATKNLQIHHVSYEPEITVTLCLECHIMKVHNNEHGTGRAPDSEEDRKIVKSVTWDIIIIDKVAKYIEKNNISSFSRTINKLIKRGLEVNK